MADILKIRNLIQFPLTMNLVFDNFLRTLLFTSRLHGPVQRSWPSEAGAKSHAVAAWRWQSFRQAFEWLQEFKLMKNLAWVPGGVG
ncbi:MAG: hypothetical protein D6814_03910 [Calditrichaeota bacterium]|nr:MAG: hypothetical protein D6814_03910 [Calditrichota bacterium]